MQSTHGCGSDPERVLPTEVHHNPFDSTHDIYRILAVKSTAFARIRMGPSSVEGLGGLCLLNARAMAGDPGDLKLRSRQ
ncbi:MAG: hypothetical protein JXL80_16170, partial [Planctomycetes bacterium]|nr:hypothetical protein [Planctomycetota bacterium]